MALQSKWLLFLLIIQFVKDVTKSAVPTGSPTENPTVSINISTCIPGSGYWTDGVTASAEGDPHFKIFNSNNHNFQGVSNGQYYYMHPCFKSTFKNMPFTLIGTHKHYGDPQSTVNVLDYIALQLFGRDNTYILFFNHANNIAAWTPWIDGNPTHYNKSADNTNDINTTVAKNHSLGLTNYLNVYIKRESSQSHLTVYFGHNCKVEITMKQWYIDVQPPSCYKCYTCGLFGSFFKKATTNSDGFAKMLTCFGGYVSYPTNDAGNPGSDNYDTNGWTWSTEYVDNNCDTFDYSANVNFSRRRLQNENENVIGSYGEYVIDADSDMDYNEECELDLIASNITYECEATITDLSECCDSIGGNYCTLLQSWCEIDTCVMYQYDDTWTVSEIVFDTITPILEYKCNTVNYDNIISYDGEPDWYVDISSTEFPIVDTTENPNPDNTQLPTFIVAYASVISIMTLIF